MKLNADFRGDINGYVITGKQDTLVCCFERSNDGGVIKNKAGDRFTRCIQFMAVGDLLVTMVRFPVGSNIRLSADNTCVIFPSLARNFKNVDRPGKRQA